MFEAAYRIQFISRRRFLKVGWRLFAGEIKVSLQKIIFCSADGD